MLETLCFDELTMGGALFLQIIESVKATEWHESCCYVDRRFDMKVIRILLLSAFVIACSAMFGTKAKADDWDNKAYLTFLRPVEIPGKVLPAGTYEFKMVVPGRVAQVSSVDETEVFGLFFTISTTRDTHVFLPGAAQLEARDNGSVKWDRVIAWFGAGQTDGEELVYYKYRSAEPEAP